jgi:hypothetical protein
MTAEAMDEYVGAAAQALRADRSGAALAALDWWSLLDDLDDRDHRVAAFALFRAHGRELASTPALGALMARPYATALPDGGPVTATIRRRSRRRGLVDVAVGDPSGSRLLVDRPGSGAGLVAAEHADLQPIALAGGLTLYEVAVPDDAWEPAVAEHVAAAARATSSRLGRVALALEMLGAAETAVALAVAHACEREQFGQPIGRYQAVRHLLAWATTDCRAIEEAAGAAAGLGSEAPQRFDEIVKALAGRNARRACERSLQVLGAIGFTAEHTHHHFHSRVLALDALLGTSADLTADLGRWLREERPDPQIARTLLAAG